MLYYIAFRSSCLGFQKGHLLALFHHGKGGLKFLSTQSASHKFANMHSLRTKIEGKTMSVHILPALQDNFMYLIVDEESKEAAVIDPVNPSLVINAIEDERINLTTILTTHHHWDHAGGNENLSKALKNMKVIGGDNRIEAINKIVSDGETFCIGGLNIKCLSTPCHTSGHICYFVTSNSDDPPCVFTGDTLFAGGCGRFFEGTADQMYDALCRKLGQLPDETKVYCGHEYTCKNLEFGLNVEPSNADIKKKLEWAMTQRRIQAATIPSTIGDEKKTNPFMRVHEPSVMEHTATTDPIITMAALRREKDNFK